MSNKKSIIHLLFFLGVFILVFWVLYLFGSYKDNPLRTLLIPVLYVVSKIIGYISKEDFLSSFAKGAGYLGLGIVNIFVLFADQTNSPNELILASFVSSMCFLKLLIILVIQLVYIKYF